MVATTLLVIAGVVSAWQFASALARQHQTDQEVRSTLARERGRLDEAWAAADLAKLRDTLSEATRTADVARTGGASAPMREEAESFREETAVRLKRAEKGRALLDALLDVSTPLGIGSPTRDEEGWARMSVLPSVDVQYNAAFRAWGLDVDGAAEADVIARLSAEHTVVVQEVVAALDSWALERRRQGGPEENWQRLTRVADQLDRNDRHRRLRALLFEEAQPRPEGVAGIVGAGSPWFTSWELTHGSVRRGLLEIRNEIDPATEPVLTAVLMAQAFASTGDPAMAERALLRALTTRPDQPLLLDMMGRLLELQGPRRRQETILYYRAARALRPHLGVALSKALIRAGRFAEAELVTQDLVSRRPDNREMWFHYGVSLFIQKKYAEAESAYRKARGIDRDSADVSNNLGRALARQGKHTEAEAAYQDAIAIQPDHTTAHFNLGNMLVELKKDDEAEKAFRKTIELNPNYAEAHNNLGRLLFRHGRIKESEESCRAAIRCSPGLHQAHNNLGIALARQKKPIEAEVSFRKAIELQPIDDAAYCNLGTVLMELGKPVDAEAAWRKAIELKPDLTSAYAHLGAALLNWQRFDEAEVVLRKLVELLPNHAESHFRLGNALLKQGKFPEAEASYRKTLSYIPNAATVHANLGSALLHQRKFVEAETACRMAIKLHPSLVEAHAVLGLALQGQEKFGEAVATLTRASQLTPKNGPEFVEFQQRIDECRQFAALQPRLPGILNGAESPVRPTEYLVFVQLCKLKGLYVAAAGLSREAFAADPKLTMRAMVRYNAACYASLAGCGRGKDADRLDDRGRAAWRQQAHDWLRQDLDEWRESLDKRKPQAILQAKKSLRHWQFDEDLVSVRGDAIARLPIEEREQWLKLWAEVDMLQRRANDSK